MDLNPSLVLIVIALFSVIQSIFGVGLLVFGTPTFLLLGVSYPEAVGYLLPSSLILSTIQSYVYREKVRIGRGVFLYSIPSVFVGMSLMINTKQQSIVTMLIGAIILLLALLRIIGIERFSEKIKIYGRGSLIITGFVHGISNQGGALLTILMGSLYSDKEKIRTNIAFAYLLFGLSQLAVLLWFGTDTIGPMSILYGCVTVVMYMLLGKNLFQYLNMNTFNLVFTTFMTIYGFLLLFPTLLRII